MDASFVPVTWLAVGLVVGAVLGWWSAGLYARVRSARAEAQQQADADKLAWLTKADDRLRETFQALAAQTLRDQAGDFSGKIHQQLRSHADQIGHLSQTLEKNIGQLDGNIRVLEQQRAGAYHALTQQIVHLEKAHRALGQTTDQLAAALKAGPVRGRWGEIQLRKIVELAGMTRHVSFDEQVAGSGGGRPDVIIHLPQEGRIPIDAKFPLNAFLEALETGDEERRRQKMAAHVKALKTQIKDLAQKSYWQEFQPAPELTILFVPIEAALAAAYELDPELIDFALTHKVIVASPLTLLGFLKSIAYGWQQFTLSKNARIIVEQAKQLQDRVETWLTHFATLGVRLGTVVVAYNATTASLQSRFLPACRRFQELAAVADHLPDIEALNTAVTLPSAPERTVKPPRKG